MTAAMGRKTISIYDYPEHLNPFREDDHKPKFWTLGKRLSRSNSINFSGIKDLKNSWALRSFMKKGKKRDPPPPPVQQPQHNKPKPDNGEDSPIVFRRAMQCKLRNKSSIGGKGLDSSMSRGRGGGTYNSMGGSIDQSDRYEYRGSVTPLPRSRFQERLRSASQHEVASLCATPRMARSEMSGSRLSIESANPFEPESVPPKAPRRKKKRAPLPPADPNISVLQMPVISEPTVVKITEVDEKNEPLDDDIDIDDMNLQVELKIVEEDDLKEAASEKTPDALDNKASRDVIEISEIIEENKNEDTTLTTEDKVTSATIKDSENNNVIKADSDDEILKSDVLKSVSFSKVDIIKYRRNSSVNEDDIKLRRGNIEDFAMANKRSKSFSNAGDPIYATYDINLNENNPVQYTNGKEKPQKVICKIYDDSSRKHSVDPTEKELMDIDKVRREFEREINKLNAALEDDFSTGAEMSVSEIKRKYDKEKASPNPIPKPRRSPQLSNSASPVNGKH